MLKWIKENKICIISLSCIFFIFLIIYRIVPMTLDGWAGKFYYDNINGIIDFIKYIVVDYYNWINGRIISNIVCGFLESFHSEIVLDIFNAFVIAAIFYLILINLEDKPENKKILRGAFFLVSLILIISTRMRKEVLFYANTAYLVPIMLIPLYYYICNKYLKGNNKSDKKSIILLSLIGFSIGTWMEHISFGFVASLGLIFIYNLYKKNRKAWKLLIPSIVSGLGTVIMVFSPGMHLARTVVDKNISVFQTVKNNFIYSFFYIFTENRWLIVVLLVMFIFVFIEYFKENKIINSIFIFISSILLLYITSDYLCKLFSIKENLNLVLFDFYSYTLFKLFFVIIIFIMLIYAINKLVNKKFAFYLLMVSLLSLFPIMFTPNCSARVTSIIIFNLILVMLIMLFELKSNNILKTFCILVILISFDKMILILKRIYRVNIKQNMIIEEVIKKQSLGEWDYSQAVIIPNYEKDDMVSSSIGKFHYSQFLQAKGLSLETLVLFSNDYICNYSYMIDDKIISKIYNYANVDYEYKYEIYYSENPIYNSNDLEDFHLPLELLIKDSDWTKDDNFTFDTKGENGNYYVEIYKRDKEKIIAFDKIYDFEISN